LIETFTEEEACAGRLWEEGRRESPLAMTGTDATDAATFAKNHRRSEFVVCFFISPGFSLPESLFSLGFESAEAQA